MAEADGDGVGTGFSLDGVSVAEGAGVVADVGSVGMADPTICFEGVAGATFTVSSTPHALKNSAASDANRQIRPATRMIGLVSLERAAKRGLTTMVCTSCSES